MIANPFPKWNHTVSRTQNNVQLIEQQLSMSIVNMYNGGQVSGFTNAAYIIGQVRGETMTGTSYSGRYVCVTAAKVSGSSRLAFRMSDRHTTAAAAKSACLPTRQLSRTGDYVLPKTAPDCSSSFRTAGVAAAATAAIAVAASVLGWRREE